MNYLEAIWVYYDPGLLSEDTFDGFEESVCSRIDTQGTMLNTFADGHSGSARMTLDTGQHGQIQ